MSLATSWHFPLTFEIQGLLIMALGEKKLGNMEVKVENFLIMFCQVIALRNIQNFRQMFMKFGLNVKIYL